MKLLHFLWFKLSSVDEVKFYTFKKNITINTLINSSIPTNLLTMRTKGGAGNVKAKLLTMFQQLNQ